MMAYIMEGLGLIHRFDKDLYRHSIQVGKLCDIIGKDFDLNQDAHNNLVVAGYLHDIGKLLIPKKILYKKGELNKEERKIIDEHVKYGEIMTYGYPEISKLIGGHHNPTKNTIIDQILTISDITDALMSKRSYKKAFTYNESEKILYDNGFNEDLIEKIFRNYKK